MIGIFFLFRKMRWYIWDFIYCICKVSYNKIVVWYFFFIVLSGVYYIVWKMIGYCKVIFYDGGILLGVNVFINMMNVMNIYCDVENDRFNVFYLW